MGEKATSINEYLDGIDPVFRPELEKIRTLVTELVPSVEETISYRMPTLKYKGRALVFFTASKKHMSFYPSSWAIEAFAERLEGYATTEHSLEIALPRARVLELLENPVHRPKWLRGLMLHEPIRGEDGQVGTESRVVFEAGGKTMECSETITRLEPKDLHGIAPDRVIRYEREIVAHGMWNAARERLTQTGPDATLWASENEYRFSGPMRLAAPLLRRVFVKQTGLVMEDFKAFAERGTDVRDCSD
ncbi:hypothetical protein GCM10009710_37120 [Aeromicrobium alkaliterrae]|uniref:YdhG-like domain-containing protein n=2 Tax=Aeromicrobium alkaliterrae TaxID=302168 RepID=A0ABP4WIE2_9ACTN